MANATALRRLLHDFKRLQKDPPPGVNAVPVEDDLRQWTAILFGPEGTPWEGGCFRLKLKFPESYPANPPHVVFLSRMFHPNVYTSGEICLDILGSAWSSVYDVGAVLISLRSLLADPNPASAANGLAATLYMQDRDAYNSRVMMCVNDSYKEVPEE